jgi:TusA-related sulfurtransferase
MNNISEISDLRNKPTDDAMEQTFETLQNLSEGEILEIIISVNADKNEIVRKIEDNGNYRIAEVIAAQFGIHIFIKVF